jgi:hypothetical protein
MRVRVALICAATLLVVAGYAYAAATRAEYVAQADPICAAADKDIAKLNRRSRHLFKKGRFAASGHEVVKTGSVLTDSVERVRAIPRPPGDEATVAAWLSLVDRVASNNRKIGRAIAHRRVHAVLALEKKGLRIRNKAHALVQDWGFHACA